MWTPLYTSSSRFVLVVTYYIYQGAAAVFSEIPRNVPSKCVNAIWEKWAGWLGRMGSSLFFEACVSRRIQRRYTLQSHKYYKKSVVKMNFKVGSVVNTFFNSCQK